MENYTVYMHTCPNGKRYIGITMKIPELRWQNGTGYKTQLYFYRAIEKYGWENIKHEILYSNLSKEEAEQKERELITNTYNSNNPMYGYNIDNGGNHKGKCSEQTKEKISVANKGRKASEETKKIMSEQRKGSKPWNLGKSLNPLSEEHKKKLSISQKGISKHTEESKLKLSIAHKGKIVWNKGVPCTLEHRNAISVGNKGKIKSEQHKINTSIAIKKLHDSGHYSKFDYSKSDETKQKISDSLKGNIPWNKGIKIPYHGKTFQVDMFTLNGEFIETFCSFREASRKTSINDYSIAQCCKGKQKTSGGYIWRYAE